MDRATDDPLIEAGALVREAWAAMARRDADAALGLWQALRVQAPENPDGHIWPIAVLWQAGRFEEAEAMAAAAAARVPANVPGHQELLVQQAWIATSQQRWEAAAERWAVVRDQAPERVEPYVHGAHALWLVGRLDDAEAIATAGAARFPGDVGALRESAWIATAREDWVEALRRWTRVAKTGSGQGDARARIAEALRMLGRLDDGEKAVTSGLADHPDDTELLIEAVRIAIARQDWVGATQRLDGATKQAKEPRRVTESFGAIEQQLRLDAAAQKTASQKAAAEKNPSADRLVLQFESIGERCDFGAVQRNFGAEPLGLLRFAWSKLDSLVAALDDRFEAVGTAEDTSFERFADETIVLMRKYRLIFHTFVEGIHELPPEQRDAFYGQQRRRLLFLKDKLIRDLEDPQKILIYATEDYAADEDVARLFKALRAYGPNRLLYVRQERADRPAGMVERLEDGLFAGYFPGMTDFVAGNQPPFELWLQLCRQTYRLSRASRRVKIG